MSQTLKKYLIALTMISAMAISSPTYAFCFFNCDGDNSEQIEENAERIEQVNKEDMRVKNGTVSGDNLSLRVEDEAKTQGRDEIYGEDVNIDVSSLNQSEEVVSNKSDIDANAARIEQVNKEDMRVKSGELNDGTLTLRVEDMEKTQGRDEIYGKDVDIDLSDLDQSEEVSENRTDINTNTTNISNNRTDIDQNTDRSVANENRKISSFTDSPNMGRDAYFHERSFYDRRGLDSMFDVSNSGSFKELRTHYDTSFTVRGDHLDGLIRELILEQGVSQESIKVYKLQSPQKVDVKVDINVG